MATTSNSERRLFKDLPPEPRRKILAYLQEPTYMGWCGIRYFRVSPHGQTLYDVVDSIDRNWAGMYPSMILVARASKKIDQQHEDLKVLEM